MRKLLVVLTLGVLASGCRERSETSEGIEVSKPAEPDVESDEDFVDTRESYATEARERLARIDARIRELAERGEAKAEAAAEELREQRDELAQELDEIGEQAEPTWERFKENVSRGFEKLERRLDQVTRE